MLEKLDLKKLCALGCLAVSLLWTGPASGVDFIRGDVNGDRMVSMADAQKLVAWLFRHGDWLDMECLNAADANDSGSVDIADVAAIGCHVFALCGRYSLPSPFPQEGPDPTPNPEIGWGMASECESYGGGSPIEDSIAKIEILDATCQGGGDSTASLTVLVSSSTSLGGYWGEIHVAGEIIENVGTELRDLTGTVEAGWLHATVTGGVLRFGGLLSAGKDVAFIPPGRDIVAFGMTACLEGGTPAGEYPIVLEAGELVDWESSRAILPSLTGGTLTVLQDVAAGAECSPSNPPSDPPPPISLNAVYRLADENAAPGETVAIDFFMWADAGIQGYSFSIDFDEDVLQAESVEQVWKRPDGSEYSFAVYEIDNERANPGSAGVDEGFVVGAAVIDFQDAIGMPANEDILAVSLHFRVSPETTSGVTQLEFIPGGQVSGDPVPNMVAAYGEQYTPDLTTSFVFLGGSVEILPDITLFIRGDSNGDDKVDLSDAATTLGFLFLGSSRPRCFDASDANDDGTVNIADPIFTLQFLFLGGTSIPSPFPAEGEDATEDGMTCLSLSS